MKWTPTTTLTTSIRGTPGPPSPSFQRRITRANASTWGRASAALSGMTNSGDRLVKRVVRRVTKARAGSCPCACARWRTTSTGPTRSRSRTCLFTCCGCCGKRWIRDMSPHAWNSIGGALVRYWEKRLQSDRKSREEFQPVDLPGDPYRKPRTEIPPSDSVNPDDKQASEERVLCLGMYRWEHDCFVSAGALSSHVSSYRAVAGSCLVHLCIDEVERFPLLELACLADMPLTVLELVQSLQPTGDVVLDDRLCRAWGRRANSTGGFPSLRVLRIASRWHLISDAGLMDLRSLPRLMIVDITRRPRHHQGAPPLTRRIPGWRRGKSGLTMFDTYAQAYLGWQVESFAGEIGLMGRVYRNSSAPLSPIWRHRHFRPKAAYKHEPKGSGDDGKGNVRPDGGSQGAWDSSLMKPRNTSSDEGDDRNGEANGEEAGGPVAEHNDPNEASVASDDTFASFSGADPPPTWDYLHMPRSEVFGWLGLVDYYTPDPEDMQKVPLASFVPVPRKRFMTMRLRANNTDREGDCRLERQGPPRLIYYRSREDREGENEDKDPPVSWAPRADDRRATGLNARKRKRQETVGDLLSSFGVSGGSKSSQSGK
ncbi:hypothetical protein VTJ83DRAFT_3324 [Remersonia thermophila]|uniref:Uncharacterized protein n=1 Tax=Remersonia thermophila TaxID=72144 RepID=A0ABR4DDN7_9PEZI